MFQAQVSFFFGNIPFAAVCIAVAIILLASMRKSTIGGGFKHVLTIDVLITTLASAAALNVLLLTMIARHPPVYSIPDHSFWYYTLSIHVIILFGVSAWFGLLTSKSHPRWRHVLWLLLLILVGFNVGQYRRQREIMIRSTKWFKNQYEHSQFFVAEFASTQSRSNGSPETAQLNLERTKLPEDEANFLEEVQTEYAALKERP